MLKGHNGQARIEDGCVIIDRKGLVGFASRNGTARIPLDKISYVQVRKTGSKQGFINFVMAGSPQVLDSRAAQNDPTCIMLTPYQQKDADRFRMEVEAEIVMRMQQAIPGAPAAAAAPGAPAAPVISVVQTSATTPEPSTPLNVDEIKKLSELLQGGFITQDEFDAKKKQLLGL